MHVSVSIINPLIGAHFTGTSVVAGRERRPQRRPGWPGHPRYIEADRRADQGRRRGQVGAVSLTRDSDSTTVIPHGPGGTDEAAKT